MSDTPAFAAYVASAPFTLAIGKREFRATSLAECSNIYCRERDRSRKGASEWPHGRIIVGGLDIARVSYNGRVWGPNKGDDLLYDNRAPLPHVAEVA